MTTQRKILESLGIALVLTTLSYVVGVQLEWITEVNWLEVFAVFTSYSCTWLCTRQSRWNYPIGVVTTASYSLLFWQWGMPALATFNLYLVFSLIYGWFRWGADGNTRLVTTIQPVWLIGYAGLGLGILALFLAANLAFNPDGLVGLNPIDVALAVASGVAQFMLDNKKLENWTLWALINVVSIPYFISTGLYFVAFQYVWFLLNTAIAHRSWKHTMKEEM
jgi:nicotinamide mononucleotide transporter